MTDNLILHYAVLIFPIIALRDVGLAHYHLNRRIEPDNHRRFAKALFQYLSAIGLWFPLWIFAQSASSLFFNISNPILAVIISTFAALAINKWLLKKPMDWRGKPPLISRNRTYDAFLRVLADRAAEVKGANNKRDDYLGRLYRDDHARMQAAGAFLLEHRDQHWIDLKPGQLTYHPAYNRLLWTILYVLALVPAILPYALSVLNPMITADNVSLTFLVTLLATLFYSPLFDPIYAAILFGLAATLVISMGIMMEFNKTRQMVPGFAGLIILAILVITLTSFVQSYVVERVDTPIMQATNYVLDKLEQADAFVGGIKRARNVPFLGWIVAQSVGEEITRIDQITSIVRDWMKDLQSIAGSLFILPAVLFWAFLSFKAIWELHFSVAADVTFRHRMPKPQI